MKISLTNNIRAIHMICEAIGTNRKAFKDISPDENGMYDLTITLNGKEVDSERFVTILQKSYEKAVKERAATLLRIEYENIINEIHNINEKLLTHPAKLFNGSPVCSKE